MQYLTSAIYSITGIVIVISLLLLVILLFSPYGKKTITGKKEFSDFHAGLFVFTSVFSASLVYWSFFDTFLIRNTKDYTSYFKDGNIEMSSAVSMIDWVTPIIPFVIMTVILALAFNKFQTKILQYKKHLWFKVLIVIISIFMLSQNITAVAGVSFSLDYLFNYIFHIGHNLLLVVVVTLIIPTISLALGLQYLKKLAIITSIIMFFFIVILLGKVFWTHPLQYSVFASIANYVKLQFNPKLFLDQITLKSDYLNHYTSLYTVYWIAAIPANAYFFHRLMQGRSVRKFLSIILLYVALPTALLFIFNSYLMQTLADASHVVLNGDNFLHGYDLIFSKTLLGYISIFVYLSVFILSNATLIDSLGYTLAKYLQINRAEKPKKFNVFIGLYILIFGGFVYIIMAGGVNNLADIPTFKLNLFSSLILYILFVLALGAIFIKRKKNR